MQNLVWVSQNTKFNAEFKSGEKSTKKFTPKVYRLKHSVTKVENSIFLSLFLDNFFSGDFATFSMDSKSAKFCVFYTDNVFSEFFYS